MTFSINKTYYLVVLLALAIIVSPLIWVRAESAKQGHAFNGVLFYKYDCEACESVIGGSLATLKKKYRDSVSILLINTADPQGGNLYLNAMLDLNIPMSESLPLLILENQFFGGEIAIMHVANDFDTNQQMSFPNWPSFTGVDQYLENLQAMDVNTRSMFILEGDRSTSKLIMDQMLRAYNRDPIANQYALVGFICLIASIILSLFYLRNPSLLSFPRPYRWALLLFSMVGVLITMQLADVLTLLRNQDFNNPASQIIALILFSLMILNFMTQLRKQVTIEGISWLKWTPLLLSVVGMTVAIYLWLFEMNSAEAVCGAVGDCNAVQQSPYSKLFGVIPVAFLGIIGNSAFLVFWYLHHFGKEKLRDIFGVFQWITLLCGVSYFSYLTFLEAFVIGQTCFWCLTGAMAMAAQLLITTQIAQSSLKTIAPKRINRVSK